jgi:hypothetical protein
MNRRAKPITVVIKTDLENYSECLECLEEELIRTAVLGEDHQRYSGPEDLVHMHRIHEALSTLRSLCSWADSYEGTMQ